MQISFFQDWVTFYPEDGEPPLSLKVSQALNYLMPSFTKEGIRMPNPIPAQFGGGCDFITYKINRDTNVFEEILAEHAKRVYSNYYLYKKIFPNEQ